MRREHKKEKLEEILFSKENNMPKEESQGENQRKKNKQAQGITLIALVITVIMLLILAGVTINAALGENGLLKRAKSAVDAYKEAEKKEQDAMENLTEQMDHINPPKAGSDVNVPKDKDWEDEKVDAIADGEGGAIPVPEGFYYAGGTKKDGFVISDQQDDDLKNTKKGNQFVWIPCTDSEYTAAKDNVMDKRWSHNDEYVKNGSTGGKQLADTSGDGKGWTDTYDAEDVKKLNEVYTGDVLPTSEWQSENQITTATESIKKYGGFYIARFEAGVPDNAPFSVTQANKAYRDIERNHFTVGWESQNTFKGRGGVAGTSDIKSLKPVSQKGAQAWNYITQPNSKLVAENMYNDGSVGAKSYLVDSQAWNVICNKFQEIIGDGLTEDDRKGKGIKDSSYIGHYVNNSKTNYDGISSLFAPHKYVSSNLTLATTYQTGSVGSFAPKGVNGDSRLELATGSSDDFKVYNIYDMAGNMWEWTTQHNTVTLNGQSITQMYTVPRGGSFHNNGTDEPVVNANGAQPLTMTGFNLGFRVVLYVT